MKRLLTYVLILGGVMLAALSGCQKEEVEPAKAKTYNIFENVGTNPYIQNLVSYLKQKGDTASFRKTFALEYGIPLWRKATVLKQGSVTSMLVPLKDCEANFISGIWIFEVKDGYIRYNVARNEQCKSYYKELEPFFRELEQSLFGIKQKGAGYMRKGGILKGFEEVQTEYCVWTNVCDGPWVLHCWYVHDLSFYRDEDGDAGSSGGGVIPDPKPEVDTKDPSFKDTKADCVFKKLVGATATTIYNPNTVVGLNLKNYWGKEGFNCKFVISDTLSYNKNAWTKYNGCNEVIIVLRENYVNEASTIDLARTIIHETIHAFIFSEIALQDYTNNYLGVKGLSPDSDFGLLWNRYRDTRGTYNVQHESMADNYIKTIRDGLKDFLARNPSSETFSDSELESIAWAGLHNTSEYQARLASMPSFRQTNEEAWKKAMSAIKDCQ